MVFDTHAHLNDPRFDPDRSEAVARARAAGLAGVVEVADAPEDWERALALAAEHPGFVWCALGLHPYHADRWAPGLAGALAANARRPGVVAAGEVGLDYAKCEVPRPRQMEAFRGMLASASDCGLPVIIHCRDAYADLVPVLSELYGGRAPRGRFHGVVHCFSGTAEEALACARLGFALGADGPVTYPKNDALRAALLGAGLDALVLETDSPWLPPQSKRGKRCEPADLPEVAARLAAVFGVSENELARVTNRNARELYGLPETAVSSGA